VSVNVGAVYPVTFQESGLPAGTLWYVNLTSGPSYHGTTSTLSATLPNGTYPYTVGTPDKTYAAAPGSFVVNGAGKTVDVSFAKQLYGLTITESGLPARTLAKDGWTVVLGGIRQWSTHATISFTGLANGTYPVLVTGPNGYVETTGALTTVKVSGSTPVAVAFAKGKTLTLTFTEKGLAKGQSWCVSIDNATACTKAASQKFVNLTASSVYGDYSYAVVSPLVGQHITAAIGKTTVLTSGSLDLVASTTIAYTFAYDYAVTFTETGAPSGTWSVTIGTTTLSNNTGEPIVFHLVNGTYSYKIGAIFGYKSSGSPKRVVVPTAVSVTVTYTKKKMPVPHAEGVGNVVATSVPRLGARAGAESAVVGVGGATSALGMLGAALALARTGRRPGDEGEG
jgi:hypothetical protein